MIFAGVFLFAIIVLILLYFIWKSIEVNSNLILTLINKPVQSSEANEKILDKLNIIEDLLEKIEFNTDENNKI